MKLLAIGLAAGIACSACASGGPVPADKLSRSQAALRAAQEIGAERNVKAAPHLADARRELAAGRKMVIAGDQDNAATMLLRAEADADLAMNMTREDDVIADAQKTRSEIQALQVSMKGVGNQQ